MKITVTKKHIDAGIRNDCERCPIALAILESVPDSASPTVDHSEISFLKDNRFTLVHSDTPRSAEEFIERFDNGLPVQPFTFEIE